MRVAWDAVCAILQQPDKAARVRVEEYHPTRTQAQNALLWAVLTDIARQVQWSVDGKMQHLEPEDWKHILTAGLRKNHRIAQGVDGGFVILGQSTSRMTIAEMSELIELCHAFGAEHGVVFHEDRRAAA